MRTNILELFLPDGADRLALFLDVDGTLIDIAPTPGAVRVAEGLTGVLDDLGRRLGGALAILTGRPIRDIDQFFAPLNLVAAGVHGTEMRTAPHGPVGLCAEPLDTTVLGAVRRLADMEPGIIVEPKLTSVAVHHRLAPGAGPRLEAALETILADGPDHLILCRGRKVFEIVPRHISKGTALERMMHLDAFRGRRPVMIGDDTSDQSAFDAAERLGGAGLKVCGERFSAAEADFPGPGVVRDFLARFARGEDR